MVRISKEQPELEEELVLPLLDKAAGRDDQATMHVLAQDQFLDEQARHDRLAGTGVVCQEEPKRRARQKLTVYRSDLVRQWPHVAGCYREHRVVQAGKLDALGLGDHLEVRGGSVEGTAAGSGDGQGSLVTPEQHTLP